ncbi:MAG: nucleotidyl transferase AbiEii/AbiGii toxin family protein [Bacteroidales bacterium]|nr:nucleotidyl transferase AbiEii/AbiGii toxin family protein [Bacteroidales bacterium]
MLQISTITPDTLELLKKLQSMPELAETRLVGGTALALLLGHRLSIDLDLFGKIDQEVTTRALQEQNFKNFEILSESKAIKHYMINDVKVDIVKYDYYSWLEEMIVENGIRLAGLKDIAAMKIGAITNRGSRKDFIDLFFLLKQFNMKEILEFYQTKYPDHSIRATIQSLSYFIDAEKEDMPKMLIPVTWNEMKKQIIDEVKKL